MTQQQADRFQFKAEELTQNPDIAFDAGLAAFDRHALGAAQNYVLSYLTPPQRLAQVEKTANALTRTLTFSTSFPTRDTSEIRVEFAPWAEEKPYQCRNRFGSIIAAVRSTDYNLVSYEHPECLFKGETCCRYLFRWERPVEKKTRQPAQPGRNRPGGRGDLPLDVSNSWPLPASGFWPEFARWRVGPAEKSRPSSRPSRTQPPNSSTRPTATNNALVTKEIGQARKQETAVVEILRGGGTEVMRQRLRYSFGIILLHDPTKDILAYGHSYGFSPEQQKVMESSSLLASVAWEESKIWEVFRSQKSVALGKLSKDLPAKQPPRSASCRPCIATAWPWSRSSATFSTTPPSTSTRSARERCGSKPNSWEATS